MQLPTHDPSCCEFDITYFELCQAVNTINVRNFNAFYSIVNKYKLTKKARSFVIHISVFFNHYYQLYLDMLCNFGKERKLESWSKYWSVFFILIQEMIDQNFLEDPGIKHLLEMLSYNVMDYLTRKYMWGFASRILAWFENNLDSFVGCEVRTLFSF